MISLIPCAKDCEYQTDGICGLESCAPVTNSAGGCPYYIQMTEKSPSSGDRQSVPGAPTSQL